jgi:hypothetical protein
MTPRCRWCGGTLVGGTRVHEGRRASRVRYEDEVYHYRLFRCPACGATYRSVLPEVV